MAPLILDNFGLVLLNNLIHFIIEVEGNLGLSDPSLFTNKNQGSLEILRNLPNIPLLLNSKPGVEFQGYLVQSSSGPWVSSRDALSTGFTHHAQTLPENLGFCFSIFRSRIVFVLHTSLSKAIWLK